jgi:hypothetical protein
VNPQVSFLPKSRQLKTVTVLRGVLQLSGRQTGVMVHTFFLVAGNGRKKSTGTEVSAFMLKR